MTWRRGSSARTMKPSCSASRRRRAAASCVRPIDHEHASGAARRPGAGRVRGVGSIVRAQPHRRGRKRDRCRKPTIRRAADGCRSRRSICAAWAERWSFDRDRSIDSGAERGGCRSAARMSRARAARPPCAMTSSNRTAASTPSLGATTPSSVALAPSPPTPTRSATPPCRRFGAQPHVGGKVIEVERAAAVDRRPKLSAPVSQPARSARARGAIRRRARRHPKFPRVEPGERIAENRNAVCRGDIERGDSVGKARRRRGAQAADLDAAARGDFDDAVAMRARRRAQRRKRRAEWCRSASAAPAIRRRSASAPTVRGRRRAAVERIRRGRSCHRLRAQCRKAGIDIVAARMPKAAPPRGIEPLGNRGGGLRIFAQQKGAHVGVGDIGLVQEIEQFARRPRRWFPQRRPADRRSRRVRRRRAGRGASGRR